MHPLKWGTVFGIGAVALVGCATVPDSPSVRVMPAPGKPFEVFVSDDHVCRSYASQSISGKEEAANNAAIGSAVAGTAIGAAAEALALVPAWAWSWARRWVPMKAAEAATPCSAATTLPTSNACTPRAICSRGSRSPITRTRACRRHHRHRRQRHNLRYRHPRRLRRDTHRRHRRRSDRRAQARSRRYMTKFFVSVAMS